LLWHLIAVCITLSISTNCKYLLVKVAEEKPNFEDFSDQATEDEESVKQGLDYMYQNRFALHQQDSWTNDGVCCCFMDMSCFDCRDGVNVSESEEKVTCEK